MGRVSFSSRLELALNHSDMTAVELSKKTGVSEAVISQYRSGKYEPKQDRLELFASVLNVNEAWLMGYDVPMQRSAITTPSGVRIPVYGKVAAGIPITAITDYSEDDPDDWEEIPAQMARGGEYIALRIQGDSMEPRIRKGDVVIVRIQEQVENGDIAIVFINGDDATCKRVKFSEAGLTLISNNPTYEPMFFTPAEVESLPIRFLGKVVELRGKL